MSIYNIAGDALAACYGVNGAALPSAFDAGGSVVFNASRQTDYSKYSISSYRSISIQNTQGMDIYNGVLFQFRGTSSQTVNDLVSLYNFATGGTIKNNMAITCGHANAVAFSKTLYDQDDEFPIIYTGDWFNPIVHVNRVTRTSSTHLYDIVYDEATAGYHSNPCIDFENDIMYTVGYYLNSTNTAEGNYCIVCKWDLADMTDNGDGTYTPTMLGTYNRDYIYVMQDLKFNDGYCWIESGYSESAQYLYGMNPDTGIIDHTVLMPITTELEGLVWMTDAKTGLYYAYVGFQGGKYYKITFAEAAS